MDLAAGQKAICDEFARHAEVFRQIGNQALALWGELDRQGRKLSTCPSLSLVVGKSQEFWAHASHYGTYHLHLSDPTDTADRYFFKESLQELKKLRLYGDARVAELHELIERARDELRSEVGSSETEQQA